MKNKILIVVILLISVFFINIQNGNCEDYSNDNANVNMGKVAGGTGCGAYTKTGWCGVEMQGIQVRIYHEDGTLIGGPAYFVLKSGTSGTYLCGLKSDHAALYNFNTINEAKNAYQCISYNVASNLKTLSGYDKAIWGMYFSNANEVNTFLVNDNYAKFKEILTQMNYKYDYNVSGEDYAIIEPLVTVKVNGTFYTGTITALLATDKEFNTGSWNYVNIYSLIGQTFKLNTAGTCYDSSLYFKTSTGNVWLHRISKTSNYNKCGYNRFNIKDVFIMDTCDSRANTNIPSQRINLYQTSYPEDNNLLNFELDGATACSSKENDNFTASCLRAELSSGSTFNEKNLSNYNFKITMPTSDKVAYCLTSFNLTPSISTPNFGSGFKAGMAFIGGTNTPSAVAVGDVSIDCYLYDPLTGDNNVNIFQNISYDSIISSVTFAGQNLLSNSADTESQISVSTGSYNTSNYIRYYKTYGRVYTVPEANVVIGSGKIVDEPTAYTRKIFGYFSKLNDSGTVYTDFGITLNSNVINKNLMYSDNKACYYTIDDGIIVNNEPRFKFRTIDTNNPFIGKNDRDKNGNGRTVGSNWCYQNIDGTYDCSSDNKLVQSVIIDSNNSYNRLNQKPKYKFVLNPTAINKIREYNKNHKLDEFDLVCDTNYNCKSNFFITIGDYIKEGKQDLIP